MLKDLLFLLIPFIIGLVTLTLNKIPLMYFQGEYTLLTAGLILINSLNGKYSTLMILLVAALGVLSQLVMAGFLGQSLGTQTYGAIEVGVGLFPWFVDWRLSFLYVVLFFILSIIMSVIQNRIAKKKFSLTVRKIEEAKKELSEKDYLTFKNIALVKFPYPLILSAVLSSVISTVW